MKRVQLLSLLGLLLCGCCHTPVHTYTEAADPTPLTAEECRAWDDVSSSLNAAWGDHDMLYSRSRVPHDVTTEPLNLAAWRGERLSAMAVMWSAADIEGVKCHLSEFRSATSTLPASIASAHFVRYTLADMRHTGCQCGRLPNHPHCLMPDMLDSLDRFDLAANTTRPVWVKIAIPQDAAPGIYTSTLTLAPRCGRNIKLPLVVEVVNQLLPASTEWGYHLDLWQHPSAVARVYNVEMWSDEHFELLRREMEPLAKAGQKVITATLNRDPWRFQCNDDYESMIHWTLNADGSWSYDYTTFDRWVELMMELGINKQINCYSMLPWGDCTLEYWDGTQNRGRLIKAIPGTPAFEKMWAPFLVDFSKHLRQKGWLGITNMAVDERAPEDMDEAARLIAKHAPELGFALADNHNSYKRYTNMRDVCISIKQEPMAREEIARRRQAGFVTTFYICCVSHYPNAFTYSDPYESELLGWYGVAHDYDGMLRWAYNSWPQRPEYDSRFRNWASGDTFFVYPGCRTTMRFERMIDGIEVVEKIRQLRRDYAGRPELKALDAVVEQFHTMDILDREARPWREMMHEAQRTLHEVSKQLSAQ